MFASLVLTSAKKAEEKKSVEGAKSEASSASKKQDKRGLLDLGYGYGGGLEHGGIELGHGGFELGHGGFGGGLGGGIGLEEHGHVKSITIHKEIPVPVPHPYPVPVEKKVPVPYPVKVSPHVK